MKNPSFVNVVCFAAVVSLAMFGLQGAMAAGTDTRVSLKGFGSFGATRTDTNNIAFRRDITQSEGATKSWRIDTDSRLGLQVDFDATDTVHLGVQWVARSHAGNFAEQNLDWAYLRWRPRPDIDVRIGRLGFDTFALSDFRNVGYTYPWIRPPHEFYAPLAPYHFDGADIKGRFSWANGVLTLKANAGHSFLQVPDEDSNVTDASLVVAGSTLTYERDPWQARLGYQYSITVSDQTDEELRTSLDSPMVNAVWPGARSLIDDVSTDAVTHYSSAGLAYDDGVNTAQLEVAYTHTDTNFFPSFVSGYFNFGRRFDRLTLYALVGVAETLSYRVDVPQAVAPIPEIVALRDGLDTALNNNGIDQKSFSLGTRWDARENVALKFQWGHYWFGDDGTKLWTERQLDAIPDEVNVWSVGVDFVF
jgi:hypothetical protein